VTAIVLALLLAAQPITLEEARQLSRINTAERLQELQIQIAMEQVRTSRSAVLPQLSLAANATRIISGTQRTYVSVPFVGPDGTTGFRLALGDQRGISRNNFDASLTLSQLLFDGGKWWNQIGQSGALEQAAAGQLMEQKFTSENEGIRRFYALYVAQRTLDVFKATATRSAEQLERANALFEAGRSPKSDVIQAQVNLGNDRINAILQEATIGSTQSDLAVWISHPGVEDLFASEPAAMKRDPFPAPGLEESVKIAKEKRPLLKALSQQVRAADLGVSVARGGFWPSLTAQGQYIRSGPDFGTVYSDPNRQNTVNFGLQLRWSIFSGFATDAQVRTAIYNRSTAELNLFQAGLEVEGDVRRYLRALQAQIDATEVARKNLKSAEDGVILAEERFKAGAGSTLEVRDAELKLTQAQLALLQTRVNVETARANLDRVTGAFESGESQ
jgi:outer membrane protein TolC